MTTLLRAAEAVRCSFADVRLLLLLWLLSLLPVLSAWLPFATPVRAAFDRSLLGREDPFLSGEVLVELAHLLPERVSPAGGAVGLLVLLLLAPAVAGGTLGRFLEGGPFRLGRFFASAGHHYLRTLRLFLWALVLLAILALPLARGISALARARQEALYQGPLDRWAWVLGVVAALLLALWRAAFDLARALAVARDERRTRRCAWQALRAAAISPSRLAGHAAIGLASLVCVGVLVRAHAAVPVAGGPGILAALLVAQLVVWTRAGFAAASTAYALSWAGDLGGVALAAPRPADRAAPVADPAPPGSPIPPTSTR